MRLLSAVLSSIMNVEKAAYTSNHDDDAEGKEEERFFCMYDAMD